MLKKAALFLLSLFLIQGISAKNIYEILGEPYDVDTLFHAQVGPGTTQTSLLFKGPKYDLRAFYLKIDITNPHVSIHAVCANDILISGETTSAMAKRKSKDGKLYYAGVNGDFYVTTGNTTSGTSMAGTPVAACIVDNEFYKTSNANRQFAIDVNGRPYMGRANFYTGMAEKGSEKVLFRAVNEASPDNGVTLYTSRYYGSTNQPTRANACAEVTAKLVEGDVLTPGHSCRMEITSTATSTGDLEIPKDGFVLHGRGNALQAGTTVTGLNFVKDLKVGDIVTLNSVVMIDGTNIIPAQMVSGNPRTVGNGETLDTEGERGDASSYHPRSGIGYGDNGNTVIMMVVDGRSTISYGARTSQVGEIMRYAGATDAINLDGGGSSTLYTSALGVRNVPSDGSERSIGNAIYAVSDAPEDLNIASIKFVDWAMSFPKHGMYKPKFYGYNQSGMLVDADVKGVVLSCPAELGHIVDGLTFVGDGNGTHALRANLGNMEATIPVTIIETDNIKMRHTNVINDGYNEYAVEVQSSMSEKPVLLSPSALTWSTADASIVDINAQTGILKGVVNGETTVTGTLGNFVGQTIVTVEKPTAQYMALDPNFDASTWKITQTGGKNITATLLDNGIKLTYTGASGRGPNIKLSKEMRLWSLPDAIRIRINPGDAPIKKITISTRASGSSVVNTPIPVELVPNQMNIVELKTSDWCDADDLINYPLSFLYMQFDMGTSTTGKEYTILMPGFETVYNVLNSGVESVTKDTDMVLYPNPVKTGSLAYIKCGSMDRAVVTINNVAGEQVSHSVLKPQDGVLVLPTSTLSSGLYVVTVTDGNITRSSKLVIK